MLCRLSILFLSIWTLQACSSESSASQRSTDSSTSTHSKEIRAVYDSYPQAALLQQYLKPYPDQLTSAAPANAEEIRTAMAAYNAGEYMNAVEAFPNFSRKAELIGNIHLYRGISYLMAGKEHDAFQTFQLIRSNHPAALNVSEWYIAMCYLAYNNIYEARRKLESIIEKGTYGKENAAELLEALPVK